MRSLAKLAIPTLFTVALAVASTACGGESQGPKSAVEASAEGSGHAEVGKPAPDLSIRTLNGKGTISLASLAGKTVIVDFWATWCGPCKKSFPKLEEMQRQLGDGVVIVGVSVDDDDSGVLDFAKENGATFPIGWDEGHAIASRWKVSTMPTSFIVDGAGVVRYVHAGYHDDEPEKIAKEAMEVASSRGSAMAKRQPAKATAGSASNESAVASREDGSGAASKSDAAAAATAAPADEQEHAPPMRTKKPRKAGSKGSKKPRKKA